MKNKLEFGELILDEIIVELKPNEFKARDFLENYRNFNLNYSVIRFLGYSQSEIGQIINDFSNIDRKKFQCVESIEFINCGINNEILIQFLGKLPRFPNLKFLNLQNNHIDLKGFDRLLKCLSQTSLENLDVSNNNIKFSSLKPNSFMEIVNLSSVNLSGNRNLDAIGQNLRNSKSLIQCTPSYDFIVEKRQKAEAVINEFLQFLRNNAFDFLTIQHMDDFLGKINVMLNVMTNVENPKISQDWYDLFKDAHLLGGMRDLAQKISNIHKIDRRICFVAIIDSFAEMAETIENSEKKIKLAKNILAEEKQETLFDSPIDNSSLELNRNFTFYVSRLDKFHVLVSEKIQKMQMFCVNQKALNHLYEDYTKFSERKESWVDKNSKDDFTKFVEWLKSCGDEKKKIFAKDLKEANPTQMLELLKEREFVSFEDLKTAFIFKEQGHFLEKAGKNLSLSC